MVKARQPHLLHPLRVMMRVETEKEKIVAVLHEGVEDSQPPHHTLGSRTATRGLSEPGLAVLEGVTRIEGKTARMSFAVR